jgi:hypothetical protein
MTDQEKYNYLLGVNHVEKRYMYAGKKGNVQDIVLSLCGKELAQKTIIGKGKREQVSYFITSEGNNLTEKVIKYYENN